MSDSMWNTKKLRGGALLHTQGGKAPGPFRRAPRAEVYEAPNGKVIATSRVGYSTEHPSVEAAKKWASDDVTRAAHKPVLGSEGE